MCDTPPVEKRKITRRAFGAKCGARGASGSAGAARFSAASSSPTMAGNSADPPIRERKTSRRFIGIAHSIQVDELAAHEQRAGEALPDAFGPFRVGNAAGAQPAVHSRKEIAGLRAFLA